MARYRGEKTRPHGTRSGFVHIQCHRCEQSRDGSCCQSGTQPIYLSRLLYLLSLRKTTLLPSWTSPPLALIPRASSRRSLIFSMSTRGPLNVCRLDVIQSRSGKTMRATETTEIQFIVARVTGYVTGKHSPEPSVSHVSKPGMTTLRDLPKTSANATQAIAIILIILPHGSGMAKYRCGSTFSRPRQRTISCGMTMEVWQKMTTALIMDAKTLADPRKMRPYS